MTAVELQLNATYAQHPALKPVDEKSQSMMCGKLFISWSRVFKLPQGLPDSKTGDLNCLYEVLVQKEALIIYHLH